MGPSLTFPIPDRFLVPLDGSSGRPLAAPAQISQESADVVGVVCDLEFFCNQIGDPLAGPQLGGKTMRPRPVQEKTFELLELLRGQPGRATVFWGFLESLLALVQPSLPPAAG